MDAYLDCFSGISGDMVLGAFIDLGVPVSWLKENMKSLCSNNFDISVKKAKIESIKATNCNVQPSFKKTPTTNYRKIINLIEKSNLASTTKQKSIKIFHCIALAESKIHECSIDTVKLHEIGAIDSIVDIVGTVLCVEYFKINNIYSSEIPLGKGFIKCSHGTLPVPAPATLEILKGIPVYGSNINKELVTPTGAGIAVSLAKSFGKIPHMSVKKIGYGCGKIKQNNHPSLLRIILGKSKNSNKHVEKESISVIQTNIDDMNPEIYSFLLEKLFDSGALDACLIPVIMKKNRPGIKLEVICPKHFEKKIIEIILAQTTTLGVRYYSTKRKTLQRRTATIQTELGTIKVKISVQDDGRKQYLPEYDICKKIAQEKNLPIKKIYAAIAKAVPSI